MNKCTHYYTEYSRCHLPDRQIELRCSKYRGCGVLLKMGRIFRPEDYMNNGWEISNSRIVWDDGTITNY